MSLIKQVHDTYINIYHHWYGNGLMPIQIHHSLKLKDDLS